MNLLIDSLREEIRTLRKEVEELRAHLKMGISSQYYVVHYRVEYFEPIDLTKLLEDMGMVLPWEEAYVQSTQESDKRFENPTLGIYKYNIHVVFYLRLSVRCTIDTIDTYFQSKLGTASIDYYPTLPAFYERVQQKKSMIQEQYKRENQCVVRVCPILWDTMK